MLSTLEYLRVKPASWDAGTLRKLQNGDESRSEVNEDGVPNYLTGIVSSSLLWIEDEQAREEVWEAASARLAERSGRTGTNASETSNLRPGTLQLTPTAQPTITRTFEIPSLSPCTPPIRISLREPSLTADNLGHKTWLASYLLARRLPSLKSLPVPHNPSTNPLRILELGSGTGLLGIAAAALYPDAKARLTDLQAIVPNLKVNIDANRALFRGNNVPEIGVLDWSLTSSERCSESYNLILASDPLYSPSHPAWLCNTIRRYLDVHLTSRVVVELPLRKAYVPEVEEFKKRMGGGDLVLLDSGEELSSEDWGDYRGHGRLEVRCWWGVWGWTSD